ncbi:neuferricin [Neocloeon triangulifer]|uniref:neuferricin n=1 Tax=Neocloeon triangulifer TaxID=2078957 RepID=UPI00286F97AD|nr:neuferricin [Neocloeon triangulifer]XP_059479053.1 neuferricin [Neocloeon triangulifer]XP_059479055.1 neuferricin [Neocloeon triangulifer]
MGSGTAISVFVIVLSVGIHQYNPFIIPSLLGRGLGYTRDAYKAVCHFYDKTAAFVYQNTGIDLRYEREDEHYAKQKPEFQSPAKMHKNTAKLLMTKAELAQYDGSEGSKGLYVAILGSVFDVSAGKDHYGPGCSYHFFTGKDGSRAFVSGDFSENGLTDDLTGLSNKDIQGLWKWVEFYKNDYRYVGKLIGRFYDSKGRKTREMEDFYQKLKAAEDEEVAEGAEKRRYPPCNVEWKKEKGTRVWCTTKSGGVDRAWAGVPRTLHEPGKKTSRCACVEPKTAVEDPNLKEYPGCPPGADSCWIKEKDKMNKK